LERCWAEDYCNGYSSKCHEYCIGHVQLDNIYSLSNIPKKYQYGLPLDCADADRPAYEYLRDFNVDILNHVEEGHGLFIYSPTKGNGKTTWACKIMNNFFKLVALDNNLRCRGLFINVPSFLDQIKDNMNKPTESMIEEMRDLQDNLKTADLVIWDDIGTESATKWVRQTLYKFINYRESNNKSQIFTSNVSLMDLKQDDYLGDRVVNRIKGQCEIVELLGPSRRDARWSEGIRR
jgi:DNA replication protein DnaC